VKDTILQKLFELEQSENIRILYACESGSRAWGFASLDSDFDVRFIYAKSVDHYLSIAETTDVVGLPVNEVLDIGGWDIKKALKLFLKSNAPLYEWRQSPLLYREDNPFAQELRSLMSTYFSPKAGANHYLSMANNTLRDDLQGEHVKLNRYFYALRPALACLWIIEKQLVPPMEFKPLRTMITDQAIQESIDELLDRKKDAEEKAFIKPVGLLNNWLTETLEYCKERLPLLPSVRKDTLELDAVFKKYLLP
jgi:predicted nucleotidyltransferase